LAVFWGNPAWMSAQNQILSSAVKRPDFHIGTAGQALQRFGLGREMALTKLRQTGLNHVLGVGLRVAHASHHKGV
jgi:N6-adenosine-specific RNA methylase IME4